MDGGNKGRDLEFDGLLAASGVPVDAAERPALRDAYDTLSDLAARVRMPGRPWTVKPMASFAATPFAPSGDGPPASVGIAPDRGEAPMPDGWPPTLAGAASALAGGTLTSVGLTELCLARIDAHDGEIRAFHGVLRDRALAEAKAADDRRAAGAARGPLDGIPIAVKDVIEIENQPCTANSRVLRDNVAARDAAVIRRLRDAGDRLRRRGKS